MKKKVGLILGSGLGAFAENVRDAKIVKYSEIPGFPESTVEGHKGQFVIGTIGDLDVVVMQGRVHYYEGYTMQEVTFPVRYMVKEFGIDTLILTNAAGGINRDFADGTLMMLTDHITSFVPSPLIGMPESEYGGKRFPDMSNVYDKKLQGLLRAAARSVGVKLKEGVYLQTTGPNYETPSEVKMFGLLGADCVGMSTAVEAMVANALGISVCGVSCITNMAAGISTKPLTHEEVQETANRVSGDFTKLLLTFIGSLNNENASVEDGFIEGDTEPLLKDLNSSSNQATEEDAIDYSKVIMIYTDGAARGNPNGPGGYGTHIDYFRVGGGVGSMEFSEGYQKTTNNRMEILAAIVGLEALSQPSDVVIYSDSQYLVRTFNDHWIDGWIKKGWRKGDNEPVKNVDLWKRMLEAKKQHTVKFVWVKGHDGNPMNERCDFLATSAADRADLLVDAGLEG